jgi:iron(III) transport system substrate-binding protein
MKRALFAALVAAAAMLSASAPAARAADAPAGTLVLYTSQPDAIAAQTIAGFKAVAPGVKVELFRSGTTQVMSRLAAEFAAGAPKPDVLLIADAMSMESLKAAGHLAKLPGIDVSALPPGSYDPERTYFGTKLITTGIVVNTADRNPPASWADLAGPAAKGQVVLPSPLYSGAAMITAGAFAQDPALGPGFLARLAANGATAVQGNGQVLSAVAGGQSMLGMVVDFMAINAARKGAPVRFIVPKEGLTAVTEPVAMLATAHNPEAAKAFVAFLLSKAGQELAVRQGFIPVRRDVEGPPDFPADVADHLMKVDIARVLKEQDALKKSFVAAFGG